MNFECCFLSHLHLRSLGFFKWYICEASQSGVCCVYGFDYKDVLLVISFKLVQKWRSFLRFSIVGRININSETRNSFYLFILTLCFLLSLQTKIYSHCIKTEVLRLHIFILNVRILQKKFSSQNFIFCVALVVYTVYTHCTWLPTQNSFLTLFRMDGRGGKKTHLSVFSQ